MPDKKNKTLLCHIQARLFYLLLLMLFSFEQSLSLPKTDTSKVHLFNEQNCNIRIEAHVLAQIYSSTLATSPGLNNFDACNKFYHNREKIFQFLENHGEVIFLSTDKKVRILKEKFIDMLGLIHLMAITNNDKDVINRINRINIKLFPFKEKKPPIPSLSAFIKQNKTDLYNSISQGKSIVFIMGHPAPDADSVSSAIMEAYRRNLLYPENSYIPVIQSKKMIREIKFILGDALSQSVVTTEDSLYMKAAKLENTKWILVDHNITPVQDRVSAIIDHHVLSKEAETQNIEKTWEMAGSTAAMITRKLYGSSISLDKEMAKLLHAATLIDSDCRGIKKMTYIDKLVMDELQKVDCITNEMELYRNLMNAILSEDDPTELFHRDNKYDWKFFSFGGGFVKGVFNKDKKVINEQLLNSFVNMAHRNNENKKLLLTIFNVVDYEQNNEDVNTQRMHLIFAKQVPNKLKKAIFKEVTTYLIREYDTKVQIIQTDEYIDFYGIPRPISRKNIAPRIENVFKEVCQSSVCSD